MSSTQNGATNGAIDIQKLINGATKKIQDDAKAHNGRMEEYHQGTIKLVTESSSNVLKGLEDSHKKITETITTDGAETRKVIADSHAKTMEALTTSHKTLREDMGFIKKAIIGLGGVSTGEIIAMIIIGGILFVLGMNLAAQNTTYIWNQVAVGAGFFLIGLLTTYVVCGIVRGVRYGKMPQESVQQNAPSASATPEAKPEPVKAQPEKKPEPKPAADPKPDPADDSSSDKDKK
ncbi:MAG: hypothetical protein ACK5MU_00325 [Candidatus Saccharimonadales bacterium]